MLIGAASTRTTSLPARPVCSLTNAIEGLALGVVALSSTMIADFQLLGIFDALVGQRVVAADDHHDRQAGQIDAASRTVFNIPGHHRLAAGQGRLGIGKARAGIDLAGAGFQVFARERVAGKGGLLLRAMRPQRSGKM